MNIGLIPFLTRGRFVLPDILRIAYDIFCPLKEFRRLADLYDLTVERVPIEYHHSFYCSEEIEIWEVTTKDFNLNPNSALHAQRVLRHASPLQSCLTMLSWGNVDVVNALLKISDVGACQQPMSREISIRQEIHVGIGNFLWPSSVVLSRY